jgi:drug/metabolite transporter (DMT)-like permease
MDRSNFMRGVRLLGLLVLMWGLTWPITKIALSQIDPWTLRAVGLNLGGIALLIVAHFQGYRPFVDRDEVKYLIPVALFNITLWSITAAYGLSQVAAGRAIIIAYTMPVWSSILSVVVLHEPFGLRRLLGLILAVAGLAMLVAPAWKNLEDAPVGVALLIFASLSWAIGTIAYKAVAWRSPAIVLAGWQLVLGAIPITIGMMIVGHPAVLAMISPRTAAALAFVIIVPMFLCYYIWFKVVELLPVGISSIGVTAVPIIGVLAGALILQEKVGPAEGIALILIASALWAVLSKPLRHNKLSS